MTISKKIVLINNEKVSINEGKFYCENIDMKSIPEGLKENFEISSIFRKSKNKGNHQIQINNISIASSVFSFIYYIFKTFKIKNTSYLLISITPYTLIAYLLLFIFRKKTYLYLRSDGYKEYKAIFGSLGPLIYHFMYSIVTYKSHLIIAQKKLSKKKSDIVFPSQLNKRWFENIKVPKIDTAKLLYVGRVKVEKGIFSLLDIFNRVKLNAELSIVGNTDKAKIEKNNNDKKINLIGYGFETSKLINIYDDHNIFILHSYTESHPQVVDEALARKRPVVIFEEIEHIIQNRIGVFIAKRNSQSLSDVIDFILKNYSKIQNDMEKNKLPTKEEFLTQMTSILEKN